MPTPDNTITNAATPQTKPTGTAPGSGYWTRNLRICIALLCVWFSCTFLVAAFADRLTFNWLDWPFSFWVGAQGAPLLYVVITLVYARLMNRADKTEHRRAATPETDPD